MQKVRARLLATAAMAFAAFRGFGAAHEMGRFGNSMKDPKPLFKPYLDNVGMSHGLSGDKLARKAVAGIITLRHGRGPYAAWVSQSVAKGWRHGRRPGYSKTRAL